MAAESTRTPPRAGADAPFTAVFAYEAWKEERVVTRLYGFTGSGHGVRVAAEIYPSHASEAGEPQWYFSDFSSRDLARGFADEALLALEYLGCTVTETPPQVIATSLGSVSGASAA